MNRVIYIKISGLLAGTALALAVWGCTSKPQPATTSGPSPQAAPVAMSDPEEQESGAQIWSENCIRCHNLRSPSEFSADQWEIIVHHMRIRAGLTANEAEKVEAFLKSASGSGS